MSNRKPAGVGLGFRIQIAEQMLNAKNTSASFIELAPENYMGLGGKRSRLLAMAKERWPIVCHGLCGDFAGSAPVNMEYLAEVRLFLRDLGVHWYSDHLCLTQLAGTELHDLVPLSFNDANVKRAAERIRQVQDFLDMPVAVENISAYARMPDDEMSETQFISEVVKRAHCCLLLDVNNVYVNAHNFKFDARAFIDQLPLESVVQVHVAGHYQESEDLLIDTHGAPIIDPVYELLAYALHKMPQRPPVLLERDNNIPCLSELESELYRLSQIERETHVNG